MIIRADLSAGGLSNKLPCVYILTIRGVKDWWHYVGRTGTSNRTGTSSPYKRLAKHLAKGGNTQSCIWGSDLPLLVLENAAISFVALMIDQEDEVGLAEKWLHWRFKDKPSLNRETPPKAEPQLSAELRVRLEVLANSAA